MKTDPILLALGKNVSDLRKEQGLTQEKLAERSGLDSTYISGIERGVRNPSFKSLVSLASGFGISVSEMCAAVKI
jgi:transcriptional regulator with XRE-family HTH domain